MRNKILAILNTKGFADDDHIFSAITGLPVVRQWTEEDHNTYNTMMNCLIELRKQGIIEGYNLGFNHYIYRLN